MNISRDYKKEHLNRMKNKKRLVVEIEREKAEKFEALLKDHETTYTNWINNHINDFIKEA